VASLSVDEVRATIEHKLPVFRHWSIPHHSGYHTSWTIYVDDRGDEFSNPLLLEVTKTQMRHFANKYQDGHLEIEYPDIKSFRNKWLTHDEMIFILNWALSIRLIPTYFVGGFSSASTEMGIQSWGIEAEFSMRWINNYDHEGWEPTLPLALEIRRYFKALLDQDEEPQGSSLP
jgi:hypothetical protein